MKESNIASIILEIYWKQKVNILISLIMRKIIDNYNFVAYKLKR